MEASQTALQNRIDELELIDHSEYEEGEDSYGIQQGEDAGSSCDDYSRNEGLGVSVIAVYAADDLRRFLKEMDSPQSALRKNTVLEHRRGRGADCSR